ncbi:MAG: glycosyltransferase family 4 protein [Bacteroidaceae bacterium]|nr:glycosyltransferase family 4 protein [Bacteroidaceae bacterium]
MSRRIAYCTPSLYIAGGVERVLVTKANYFADVLGYEIYIILTDGKGKAPYYPLSPKVKVIHLDINFEELWHLSFLRKIPVYLKKQRVFKRKLTEVLMEIKPDITVSLLRREINFITSIKDGSKKVGEIHINRDNYRNFTDKEDNLFKRIFAYFWDKQLLGKLKHLDAFVCLTEDDKAKWMELDNVRVIPNPLPFYPEKCSDGREKRVISVGRYAYEKGFDRLARIWALVAKDFPDWSLHVYGSGDAEELKEDVNRLQIADSFFIHGPTSDIANVYCSSSLYLLTSRFEGFGMVLAEAMACGLPVVSFDCPYGPRNIITHGEDGFLIQDGDIEAYASQVARLLECSGQRLTMGSKARSNIGRLKIEYISRRWEELFDEILSE